MKHVAMHRIVTPAFPEAQPSPGVDAAQVVGASHARVLLRHLLPNVMPPMIVVASLGFSAAVLSAAALSFLGLGAQPPTAEWGLMLATGRNYIERAPWAVITPGMAGSGGHGEAASGADPAVPGSAPISQTAIRGVLASGGH